MYIIPVLINLLFPLGSAKRVDCSQQRLLRGVQEVSKSRTIGVIYYYIISKGMSESDDDDNVWLKVFAQLR